MLSIRNVAHAFGATELSYPDWQVAKGDHSVILGNSGSGKTTLLHLLGGLMPPKSGEILIDGQDMSHLSGGKLDRFRGQNIGIVFQRPHLVRSLTIEENLALSMMLGKSKIIQSRIEGLLDSLGILDLKNRKIHQISQGQAQRVSIARAVINSPKILLADEPTASLDDDSCSRVIELLKEQAKANDSTLIVATHDQRVKSEFENQLSL